MHAATIVGLLLENEGSWNFTSVLDIGAVDISLPADYAAQSGTATVKWQLELDIAERGVADMVITLHEVNIQFECDDYSQADPVSKPMQIAYTHGQERRAPDDMTDPKAMADYATGYTARAKMNPSRDPSDTQLYPTSIEVDSKHRITVYFG